MTLKSPLSVAATPTELHGYTSTEVLAALIYAANAALTDAPHTKLDYLPTTPEEALDFRPHPWVIAAICSAMRGVREGTQQILGQPMARFIPATQVPENVALVAEGRDLGFITEDRLTARTLTIEQPYARAAIKVLDEAVAAAYHASHHNVTTQTEPMADTTQPPEDMTAFKEYTPQQVADAVNVLVGFCHGNMVDAGWWRNPSTGEDPRNNPLCFSNKLMLVVSECAEAMEGDRKSLPDDKLPHLPMRDVELADALIRIGDLAGAFNLQLARSVVEKMVFNRRRKDHTHAGRLQSGGKAY